MNRNDSIFKKLENITYLMELMRDELERAVIDSLLEYGIGYNGKLEVTDITEDDGSILEGFFVTMSQEEGVSVEFRDGKKYPYASLETDNMYDLFVRIHSAMLDESVTTN